jgi:hypothetical protein
MPKTTSAAPSASQTVTGSPRKKAPNVSARGAFAFVNATALVAPRLRSPTFQPM